MEDQTPAHLTDQGAAPRANFPRAVLAAACKQFGTQVGPLPIGVKGAQLLWALAGVESSYGRNCQPRHEPAYDHGGTYATHLPMPTLLKRYPYEGACSFGPFQLLLCNAPLSYGPSSFDNLTLATQPAVSYLNLLLRRYQPKTLAEIGECWNAGHVTPDPIYERKLAAAYAVPMP